MNDCPIAEHIENLTILSEGQGREKIEENGCVSKARDFGQFSLDFINEDRDTSHAQRPIEIQTHRLKISGLAEQ